MEEADDAEWALRIIRLILFVLPLLGILAGVYLSWEWNQRTHPSLWYQHHRKEADTYGEWQVLTGLISPLAMFAWSWVFGKEERVLQRVGIMIGIIGLFLFIAGAPIVD